MRFWIGITDWDWFRFLAAKPDLAEVNFWQPSAGRRPVTLEPGALFLFKLHASHGGQIVGGGFFVKYEAMPVRWTWDAFGEENGAASFDEMVARIQRYRRTAIDVHADGVGCLVLVEPYAELGPHRLENGLLLRKDLHALFDAGYVTVTPSLELRVSRRIREEFENGRDYYALDRHPLRLPLPPAPPPSAEYLEWHADAVFRG